jgi:hypothetical protein
VFWKKQDGKKIVVGIERREWKWIGPIPRKRKGSIKRDALESNLKGEDVK